MHKDIPVILLVNTISHDIKYYAYISNIWREGKKLLYKMDVSLVLRDIVSILPISPMPTLIMWLLWCLVMLVCLYLFSPTVTRTFDTNCIKLKIGSNWSVIMTLKYYLTMLMIWAPMNWSHTSSFTVLAAYQWNAAKLMTYVTVC